MNPLKFSWQNVRVVKTHNQLIIGFHTSMSKFILIVKTYSCLFFLRCIDSTMRIKENTGHSITFTIADIQIKRVEFLLRRCYNVSVFNK